MKRASYRRTFTLLALSIYGWISLGCQSDGPEFVGGDTRIVEGTLLSDEPSQSDFFVVTRVGTVNILASTLSVLNPITGEPVEDATLGVSVGQPNPEDAELCQLTFSKVLQEGESFSVYYQEGFFCLTVFRPADTQQGSLVNYVLTLTGAFS